MNAALAIHADWVSLRRAREVCIYLHFIHIEGCGAAMRTNIEIDDDLIATAMEAGGFKTKRAAVEAGLRLLAQTRTQARLRALRGKRRWEGSLDDMRRDR